MRRECHNISSETSLMVSVIYMLLSSSVIFSFWIFWRTYRNICLKKPISHYWAGVKKRSRYFKFWIPFKPIEVLLHALVRWIRNTHAYCCNMLQLQDSNLSVWLSIGYSIFQAIPRCDLGNQSALQPPSSFATVHYFGNIFSCFILAEHGEHKNVQVIPIPTGQKEEVRYCLRARILKIGLRLYAVLYHYLKI